MNIAQYVSIYKNIPVAIFSLEMSKSQLVQRMLCSEARIDSHNLRKGRLVEADWAPLSMAAGRLSSSSIFIDDTAGISCLEIRAKARRLKAQCNLGLVIVDYLQLMQTAGKVENRQQEISEISRSLKGLARELNVPLIAVSQLSRAVEQRAGEERRPRLSDLRESGAIEQDADLVIFIYREEYYRPKTEKKGIAEIIISKQRNGPTGKVTFIKEYAKFENLSRISPE
jgi:replicative DNA helicase